MRHPLLGLRQPYGSAPQFRYTDIPGAQRRVELDLRQFQFGPRFLDQRIRHVRQRQARTGTADPQT